MISANISNLDIIFNPPESEQIGNPCLDFVQNVYLIEF